MSADRPAVEVLREAIAMRFDCSEHGPTVAALALVEQLVEAAEAAVDCDDYWDWVTSYLPDLKAALRRVNGDAR